MIRHKLIINPKFQYSFIFYTLVFTLFSLGVFYFSCIYFFSELQKLGVDLKLPKDHVFFKFANLQQNKMLNITGVVTGVVLLCQISFGILYSHKIAGPLYRFTKVLKGSDKTSKVDNFTVRPNDYFPEVYEAFNHFSSVRSLRYKNGDKAA